MPRIDTFSCEPFRAWNRLEPRPREAEFDKVLQAGVHDALWMLTRQWQFGELQGEDTGSAIFSKIYMQTTAITKLKTANGVSQTFDDSIPLEERIENMPYRLDFKSRLEAAFMFLKALDHAAESIGPLANNGKFYKPRLIQLYPIKELETVQAGDDNNKIIEKVKSLSNGAYVNMVNASVNRYFDGFALYQAILADQAGTITSIANGGVESTVTKAVTDFVTWFMATYDFNDVSSSAWLPSKLEYQFDCALPGEDAVNTVLSADQYYSGDLDWFSFDVYKKDAEPIEGLSGASDAGDMLSIKNELLSVIPVEAKFAGAPNSRWWQFENGKVDLGNINAQTTDLPKLIFTEYALMYNTDWLLVPYRVAVGSLCEIKGIIVTDVFGQQFFIKSAVQGQTDNWSGWGMYNLSALNPDGARDKKADTRLLVLPSVVKNHESKPYEEVFFVRDEMTNSVWAVESHLPNELGGTADANTNARSFADAMKQIDTTPVANDVDVNAMFRYTLANTVPENWIPFIPVHTDSANRQIKLQRASMPRLFNSEFSHVRPLTQLLRNGIEDNDEQSASYFINEEEVPRAGVQLTATFQRTRWYNGTVINWYGYRKQVGRGEGSSGLYYDRVDAVKK